MEAQHSVTAMSCVCRTRASSSTLRIANGELNLVLLRRKRILYLDGLQIK